MLYCFSKKQNKKGGGGKERRRKRGRERKIRAKLRTRARCKITVVRWDLTRHVYRGRKRRSERKRWRDDKNAEARERVLSGKRCTPFWRKNASDAFAYGRLGFVRRGGERLVHRLFPSRFQRGGSPNAISPTVNRIQRKCSYVYMYTHVHTQFP